MKHFYFWIPTLLLVITVSWLSISYVNQAAVISELQGDRETVAAWVSELQGDRETVAAWVSELRGEVQNSRETTIEEIETLGRIRRLDYSDLDRRVQNIDRRQATMAVGMATLVMESVDTVSTVVMELGVDMATPLIILAEGLTTVEARVEALEGTPTAP